MSKIHNNRNVKNQIEITFKEIRSQDYQFFIKKKK